MQWRVTRLVLHARLATAAEQQQRNLDVAPGKCQMQGSLTILMKKMERLDKAT